MTRILFKILKIKNIKHWQRILLKVKIMIS
jgi:hypothetical protein